jgi:hypothetical protein
MVRCVIIFKVGFTRFFKFHLHFLGQTNRGVAGKGVQAGAGSNKTAKMTPDLSENTFSECDLASAELSKVANRQRTTRKHLFLKLSSYQKNHV